MSMTRLPLLLVDDDPVVARLMRALFDPGQFDLHHAETGQEGLDQARDVKPALVILDLRLPDMSGMEVLKKLHEQQPQLPVVMLTGKADLKTAVEAMQLGAVHYLTKPVDNAELMLVARRALDRSKMLTELAELRRKTGPQATLTEQMGPSAAVRGIAEHVGRVANSNFTALILGETGAGKELVAQALHAGSGRRDKPLIAHRWPAPPFYQRAPGATADQDGEVDLEFVDGRVDAGELVSIHPDGHSLSLRRPDGVRQVALGQVRSIRLRKPLAFVPHAGSMNAIGTSPAELTREKEFTVSYADGTSFAGLTRGFLKCSHGLYLYLPQSDPSQTLCCFVPRPPMKDFQIGQPLGKTLQERGLVSGPDLGAALAEQECLRAEMLGEYLTARAIVSAESLAEALEQQKLRPNVRLGDLLVEANLITQHELGKALSVQAEHRERRLGDILISMGAVTLRVIQVALSDKLGIPYVNAKEIVIERSTLALVGAQFAIAHRLLPVLRKGDSLVVATENPLAGDYEKDLGFMTGLTIVPVIANPDELRERIAREYLSADAGFGAVSSSGESQHQRDLEQVKIRDLAQQLEKDLPQAARHSRAAESEARVTDSTLVRLVNKIIIEAHAQGASDIHIEANPGRGTTRIRFRKDGEMENYLEMQSSFRNALISRIKIMAGLDIAEHRLAQDGKINFGRFSSVPIELRVAIIPTAGNLEDVVLRILGGCEPLPLDRIGLPDRDLREVKTVMARSHGLFLVCGPTGSGKTTTLHSALNHMNRPDMKIWTAEDPIEIVQPGLRQVQVNPKIGWTFATALRSFLRADPDVIMVGEMRDAETAGMGIEASLTGHLVLSTLHTNTAAESVTRLLNLGMDPFNFADALSGVLSQRLTRRLCPHCKRPHAASEAELTDLAKEYCVDTDLDPATIARRWRAERGDFPVNLHTATGCNRCSAGYKGRVGIYELLVNSPEIRQLIHERAPTSQLSKAAQAGGMLTLKQSAILKMLSGELDLASVRAASS